MKKIPLFIVALICLNHCLAQEVVERKNRLSDFVTEKFQTVIQSDKQIKQGMYHAFFNKNTVIASGNFTDDKKTGTWHFYDQDGKLLENFNYDTNTLTYEAPEDTTSNIRYNFDDKLTDIDVATKPIKPGGRYYGYVPYLRLFKLPADMTEISRDQYVVILELLISPLGRLADYKIHLKSGSYERVININTDLINDEDRQFIPATRNKQPVSSRILIQCYMDRFGGIDM